MFLNNTAFMLYNDSVVLIFIFCLFVVFCQGWHQYTSIQEESNIKLPFLRVLLGSFEIKACHHTFIGFILHTKHADMSVYIKNSQMNYLVSHLNGKMTSFIWCLSLSDPSKAVKMQKLYKQ